LCAFGTAPGRTHSGADPTRACLGPTTALAALVALQILNDTREIQREINQKIEELHRSYATADELIFKAPC
jgi:hypothetical protein